MRLQFLMEAIIISLMGAVCGVFLGVALGNGISLLLNTGFVVPWNWVFYWGDNMFLLWGGGGGGVARRVIPWRLRRRG